MKTRAVVAGGLLALAGVWAISAVGQSMLVTPAENPPASFEGREYVDSNGCVFIRAGVDGATTWVPRVTRDRKPVCGFEPTFSAQQLATLNAPMTAPVVSAPPPMASPVVASVPTTLPVNTVNVASDPNVVNDIFVGGNPSSGGTLVSGGSTYVPSSGASRTPVSTDIPGQVVNDIFVGGSRGSVSGPVVVETYTGGTTGGSVPLSIGIPNSRGGIPTGYKQAWDDGRINMQRGPRSSSGDASMNQVWTQTIPRQLIANASGVQRVRGGFGNSIRSVVPWMSSKQLTPGSAGAFIQVGAYGSAANVQKNIALLTQMGMGTVVQNAGAVQVVMAGPFSAADVRSALSHLRSSGYSDAFIQ